jgi:hypothetical protein
MECYALGGGHKHLADKLNIPLSRSLAIGGSANSRILRTTLKHSYDTKLPTLYVLGMTFISRSELPILAVSAENTFEGRWCNPQNQEFKDRWDHYWNQQLSEEWVKFKLMTEVYSLIDRVEDLQYQMLAAVRDLTARGHRVVLYQQADDSYHSILSNTRLKYFGSVRNIIGAFSWCAVQQQHSWGVPTSDSQAPVTWIGPPHTPDEIKHRLSGEHGALNDFLTDYIIKNNIIND